MRVSDPAFFERSRLRSFIELWIMPGFGNGSDIDKLLNFMGFEQLYELADTASGVSNGEQRTLNPFGCSLDNAHHAIQRNLIARVFKPLQDRSIRRARGLWRRVDLQCGRNLEV